MVIDRDSTEGTAWHVRGHLARVCEALARHLLSRRQVDAHGHATFGDPLGIAGTAASLQGMAAGLRGARRPRSGPTDHQPLRHVAHAFELLPVELDALLLALAVELDARAARAVALANDHMGRPRPTLGLAHELGGDDASSPLVELRERPFVREGLVELEGDGPLPTQSIRLAPDVQRRLCASTFLPPEGPGLRLHRLEHTEPGRLVLEPGTRARLEDWSDAARRPPPGQPNRAPPLLLAGAPASGRRTLMRVFARRAGYPVVEIEVTPETVFERVRAARREARWHGAALLVRVPPGFGNLGLSALWPLLQDLSGPLALALAPEELESATRFAPLPPVRVTITTPSLPERAALWRALLPPGVPLSDEAIDSLATRFHFGPGSVAACIERAGADSGRTGHLTPERLDDAARALGAARMGSLAQRLPTPFERAALIVEPRVHAELDLAVAWVRRRRRVLGDWGFAARLPFGHGLTALFAGPPGTGKTMAAQILARELGMDLYRVDLSRVMSKYIGETEKNLAQLFDEAQAAGIALFFDEADALFGKRSESQSAHDRYANVEIGYLLQRMEEYDGATVLATNRMGDMDAAFMRRFHVSVKFDLPGPDERLHIWQGMLPAQLEREAALPLEMIARKFELSGGEIKNAALAAAFLAADEGGGLAARHLARAIERELVKSGRVLDERLLGEITGAARR